MDRTIITSHKFVLLYYTHAVLVLLLVVRFEVGRAEDRVEVGGLKDEF